MDRLQTQLDQVEQQINSLQEMIQRYPTNLTGRPKTGLEPFPRLQAYLLEQSDQPIPDLSEGGPDLHAQLERLENLLGLIYGRCDDLHDRLFKISFRCQSLLNYLEAHPTPTP